MYNKNKLPDAKLSEYKQDFDGFTKKYWFKSDSLVQTVITGHLYIEGAINEFLNIIFRNPHAVYDMTFAQKIAIIKATGLIVDESTDRLVQLNRIRNKYAHNLDYVLTFEEIKKFNIGKISKDDWDDSSLKTIRFCMSYISGMLHGQVVTVRNLKKTGKIIL